MHAHAHICMHECVCKHMCMSKLCCANEDEKIQSKSHRKSLMKSARASLQDSDFSCLTSDMQTIESLLL